MAEQITPVALVTGAGSGIGRATAVRLSRSGYSVVLVGRRAATLGETDELLAEGAPSLCLVADVSDPGSGRAMVRACVERFGRLDVLVNNAGVAPLVGIGETRPETIQQAFFTNAIGPACAIAAAWPVFKRQFEEGRLAPRGQCVVNVSTLGTIDPFPGFFAYASSKAGLNVMVKSCAKEGAAIGVRAFSIAPGAVETEMLRGLFDDAMLPREKCLSAEEVAEEVMACIEGERELRNGETIVLVKA